MRHQEQPYYHGGEVASSFRFNRARMTEFGMNGKFV